MTFKKYGIFWMIFLCMAIVPTLSHADTYRVFITPVHERHDTHDTLCRPGEKCILDVFISKAEKEALRIETAIMFTQERICFRFKHKRTLLSPNKQSLKTLCRAWPTNNVFSDNIVLYWPNPVSANENETGLIYPVLRDKGAKITALDIKVEKIN